MYTPQPSHLEVSSNGIPRESVSRMWGEVFSNLNEPAVELGFFRTWQHQFSDRAIRSAMVAAKHWAEAQPISKSPVEVSKVVTNILRKREAQQAHR